MAADAIEECDTLLRERDVEPGRGILLRVNEMDQLDLDDANYTLPPELACDAEEEQPTQGDAAESDAAEVAGGGSSAVAARGGDDGGGESDGGGGGGGGGGDALALAVEPDLAVAREKEFEVMLAEERARSAALEVQVEELSQQIQEYERCVCQLQLWIFTRRPLGVVKLHSIKRHGQTPSNRLRHGVVLMVSWVCVPG